MNVLPRNTKIPKSRWQGCAFSRGIFHPLGICPTAPSQCQIPSECADLLSQGETEPIFGSMKCTWRAEEILGFSCWELEFLHITEQPTWVLPKVGHFQDFLFSGWKTKSRLHSKLVPAKNKINFIRILLLDQPWFSFGGEASPRARRHPRILLFWENVNSKGWVFVWLSPKF